MKQKGITLIALVVTIVVLLILAGVSITMLSGENGVISQAKKAKEEQTIGKEKEEIDLTKQTLKMNKGDFENFTFSATEFEEELKKYDENVQVKGNPQTLYVKYIETNNTYEIELNKDIIKYDGNFDEIDTLDIRLRYEYGYLFVDIINDAKDEMDIDNLNDNELKQLLINLFTNILGKKYEDLSDEEKEELELLINDMIIDEETKKKVIEILKTTPLISIINNGKEISANQEQLLVEDEGEYTVSYFDIVTGNKITKKINIEKIDEYVIDYNKGFFVELLHKTDNGFETITAYRCKIVLDDKTVYDGEINKTYTYFQEFEGVIENQRYFVDITANVGEKEIYYKGYITIKFPT